MNCWSSERKTARSTSSRGVLAQKRLCSTHTGRNSKRIFSSSGALMVRPLAGNPTSKRTITRSAVISQAVRSSTSWPQRLTVMSPLFPDPLARKENCSACR